MDSAGLPVDEVEDAEIGTSNSMKETGSQKRASKRKPTNDSNQNDPSLTSSASEKRARKSTELFIPANPHDTDRSARIVDGRGQTLQSIPVTRDSIESFPASSEEIVLAHRLLYSLRGNAKPPKKEMKSNILAFHGYLEKQKEGQEKKALEKQDKESEARMSAKANKLKVPEVRMLCDLFVLDRTGISDKDGLVNCLLRFLGSPNLKLCKGGGGGKNTTKAAISLTNKEEDDELPERGTMPDTGQLRKWTKAYICCFNMEKVTIKHALEIAGDKFGVDLSSKKSELKDLLTEEM
jgi:hypothetical protein